LHLPLNTFKAIFVQGRRHFSSIAGNTECHAFGNKNITQGDYTYVEVPAYVNVQ